MKLTGIESHEKNTHSYLKRNDFCLLLRGVAFLSFCILISTLTSLFIWVDLILQSYKCSVNVCVLFITLNCLQLKKIFILP